MALGVRRVAALPRDRARTRRFRKPGNRSFISILSGRRQDFINIFQSNEKSRELWLQNLCFIICSAYDRADYAIITKTNRNACPEGPVQLQQPVQESCNKIMHTFVGIEKFSRLVNCSKLIQMPQENTMVNLQRFLYAELCYVILTAVNFHHVVT